MNKSLKIYYHFIASWFSGNFQAQWFPFSFFLKFFFNNLQFSMQTLTDNPLNKMKTFYSKM